MSTSAVEVSDEKVKAM
ncbi:hypothetical protein Gohar_004485 [Gossypium harknessii]|uniref:Uncharacterized protein n=2 Tax=Gossypium TaxID=3633 RepID=A0A7J9H5C1_9ROSI|nr:hypothetical protein [Gossypium harknessii]